MNISNIVSISKKIQAGNARFEKLDAAGKRVAVAKDAMAQLLLGRFHATPGTYIESKKSVEGLTGKVPTCNVCAIGSLMVSNFRANQGCGVAQKAVKDYKDDTVVHYEGGVGLKLVFDHDQLRLMEATFEQSTNDPIANIGFYNKHAEEDYGDADELRLFLILENVIENGGTFIRPERLGTVEEQRAFARGGWARFVKARAAAKKAMFQ